MEYPKRLTAINPVTGTLIKSRGDNQETYSAGWDAIWGKKTIEDVQEILDEPSIIIPDGLSIEEMREFICGHVEND